MSGVFQIIDPPTPSPPGECVYPPPLVRGEDTLAGWRGGWGVNVLEDARHCSVLNIKYFVTCQHWSDIRKHNSLSFKENIQGSAGNRVVASFWMDDVNGLIFVNGYKYMLLF